MELSPHNQKTKCHRNTYFCWFLLLKDFWHSVVYLLSSTGWKEIDNFWCKWGKMQTENRQFGRCLQSGSSVWEATREAEQTQLLLALPELWHCNSSADSSVSNSSGMLPIALQSHPWMAVPTCLQRIATLLLGVEQLWYSATREFVV